VDSEEVLVGIETERKKRLGPLTRRFIVVEGMSQTDGAMMDLPKVVSIFVFGALFCKLTLAQVQLQISSAFG
jgi:hypothetical protein